MNFNTYLDIYNYFVIDRRIDTDEARCLMSDLEMELENDPNLDPWEWVEDIV